VRIGLISDIHGNRVALDAVLDDIERSGGVDQLICLGDVAVGPQPNESLARIRELECPVIMGNWDACFLDGMPEVHDEIGLRLVETAEWWASFLSDGDMDFIRSFKRTLEVPLDDGASMFCFHGSPISYDDWIFAATPDQDLARMFDGIEAPVLVGGHTHLQMIRRYEDAVIVNPGSVGLSFKEWWPRPIRIAAWAEYGILTRDQGQLSIDLRRTTFDVDAFLELSRKSGMPHADWWIGCWVRE
jgi:predicted phosphodiesterase